METLFISGSIAISRLDDRVKERLSKAIEAGLRIVVGDADGIDSLAQKYLVDIGAENVSVYCSGDQPRNNAGGWTVCRFHPDARPGTREYFTYKDVEMAKAADFGLMIWDSKSTGTLKNVLELVSRGKKSIIFLNKNNKFINVSDQAGFQRMLDFMPPAARGKAEKKLGLPSKPASPSQPQLDFQE